MIRREIWVFVAALVTCVGCDHATKQVAEEILAGSAGFALAGGVVQLQLVANPGAFLSLGASLPEPIRQLLLVGLVPLALALVSFLAWRSPSASRAQLAALGLVAGGGLANWLDRMLNDGAVTDFVSLGLGHVRTGIFNVADVAIVMGLLLLFRAGAGFGRPADPSASPRGARARSEPEANGVTTGASGRGQPPGTSSNLSRPPS